LAHPRPPAATAQDGVTIVVPARNDADGLAATVAAVTADATADGRAGQAIVIVDDASDDPVLLQGSGPPSARTALIRRDVQGGPAAARNDGWRTGPEPFVAFIDANCEPDRGWLDHLLPHFADPAVAAVAPRIIPVTGAAAPPSLAAYEAVSSPLDLGSREAIVRPRSPVAYVPTAALIVRRSALEALDGFDESLTVGEDVDFVWRLVAAGWTVRYEPRATVRHPVRPRWSAWLVQRYRYGTSAAALARRHGPAVAPLVVSPWTAAAWGLVAAGRPVLGVAAAGYSVAALAGRAPHRSPVAGPGPPRLRTDAVHLPVAEAVRLAGTGHLRGGLAIARALRRAWPAAAVALALASRRSRPAMAAAVVVPPLLDWLDRRPRLDPARFVALRLADDLAYAAGVWAGCARERSGRALLPDLAVRRPVPYARLAAHRPSIGGRS
jgi:mycofactocin system glycosyltransferase